MRHSYNKKKRFFGKQFTYFQFYIYVDTVYKVEIISNMGCQACKLAGQNEYSSLWLVERVEEVKGNSQNLIKASQRRLWLQNLAMAQTPEKDFWEKNKETFHSCFPQIKKDIARSFPDNKFFTSSKNLQRFEQLLKKFALYYPKVGYTQGLNFLAGYILMAGFSNNQAFEILVNLVMHEKLLLIGLYQDCFPLNRLYCSVFWKIFQSRMPKTANKIKLAGVPDEIWIFQWFMSFYLYSFPVQFVKPFFDYVICKKELSIVCLTLGIVNQLKQQISNMINPDECDFFELINKLRTQQYCSQVLNLDRIRNYANSITKFQIHNALATAPIQKNNIYHAYFLKQNRRRDIWVNLYAKTVHERKAFQFDPKSRQYRRDRQMIQQLQRLILKKCKLYKSRSDSMYSSVIRTSNFTIEPQNDDVESQVVSQKVMTITKEESVNKDSRNLIYKNAREYSTFYSSKSKTNLRKSLKHQK